MRQPLTAQCAFVSSVREERRKEDGSSVSLVDGVSMWRALPDEEKKEWEERAVLTQKRFLQECLDKERAEGGEGGGDGEADADADAEADADADADADDERREKGGGGLTIEDSEDALSVHLPQARVSRILRCNKDVGKISRDACFLVAKATEQFLERRVFEAARLTARQSRKTIMVRDILTSMQQSDSVEALQLFIDEFQPPGEPRMPKPSKRAPSEPRRPSAAGKAVCKEDEASAEKAPKAARKR